MFSYPSDEVGNQLLTFDQIDEKGLNPGDVLTEASTVNYLVKINMNLQVLTMFNIIKS